MYHIYKNGYNTLPNLKKIDKNQVFETNNDDKIHIQKEKVVALENQEYFYEYNNTPEMYKICEEFIKKYCPKKFTEDDDYFSIAKKLNEDFLIHRIHKDKDFLSSAHVVFASHWNPKDKIGKSFDEIHSPVPMNLKNSKKLVEAMIYGGNFERFVWSVVYEKKYNFHPSLESKKFDIKNPEVYIKIERQVTVGFPENDFCLFILRQYLIEEKDIDKKSLKIAIENMTNEQKKYKSLEDCENLLKYLNF
jgi:hypothetical protein